MKVKPLGKSQALDFPALESFARDALESPGACCHMRPAFTMLAMLENGRRLRLPATVNPTEHNDFVLYDLTLRNPSAKPLRLGRVRLFDWDLNVPTLRIFKQGFYMPSDPIGFYLLCAGQDVPVAGGWKPGIYGRREFMSHSMAVLAFPGKNDKLLVGFTSFNDFEGYLIFSTAGRTVHLSAWCNLEGITLAPGKSLRLERFMVAQKQALADVLNVYTAYVRQACHARVPPKVVTGWVDWQYYRQEKTQIDILRSLKAMTQLKRQGFPLEYIIIDGGWCNYCTEWLRPCAKFPMGMRRLSRRVHQAGFKFGLWVAPYWTSSKTEVARRHPEWLVMDKKTGKPLCSKSRSDLGSRYILDFTVPAVQEWLRHIIQVMVHNWKVDYVKLDGPNLRHYAGGKFHAPNSTAIQQVRKSLEIIREECGNKVLVEGEGIYGPSIGMVDIQRTQQDTYGYWYWPDSGEPYLKDQLNNDLLSGFMHNKFWHNHREDVILRDFPSPYHGRKLINANLKEAILPENELLFQVSACSLAGGAMLLSDPLDQLIRNPCKTELISQFLPNYNVAATPIDVFGEGQPSLYYLQVQRDFENWFVAGVFNWNDEYRDFAVPVSAFAGSGVWHAFEFWNREYLGICRGRLPVKNVPAHGCKLIALRRRQTVPQLIGTNLHLLQGAVEIESCQFHKDRLRIRVNHFYQKDRQLFFWHPTSFKLAKVRTNARDYLVDARRPNHVTISFNGRKQTEFELAWRQA